MKSFNIILVLFFAKCSGRDNNFLFFNNSLLVIQFFDFSLDINIE